jgi:hypothetical protein
MTSSPGVMEQTLNKDTSEDDKVTDAGRFFPLIL